MLAWQIVDAALISAAASIVLFTPDDEAKLRDEFISPHDDPFESELPPQPRPNVLFEAGVAYGRNSQRTLIVSVGKIRPMSDLIGHHILRLNNSPESKLEFAARLRDAGCETNTSGSAWIGEGNFELAQPKQKPITHVASNVPVQPEPHRAPTQDVFEQIFGKSSVYVPAPAKAISPVTKTKWQHINDALNEFKDMLKARATGGSADAQRFYDTRELLISNTELTTLLPKSVLNYRNMEEFWSYIKNKAGTYAERRSIIQDEFQEILNYTEAQIRSEKSQS